MRPPYSRRLKVSRPRSSVPSQCARLGPCRLADRSCWFGWYGAMIPAAMQATMVIASTLSAVSAVGLRTTPAAILRIVPRDRVTPSPTAGSAEGDPFDSRPVAVMSEVFSD